MNSVDWNDGMEWWSGLLESSAGLDYWSATPTILARSFLATTKLDHSMPDMELKSAPELAQG